MKPTIPRGWRRLRKGEWPQDGDCWWFACFMRWNGVTMPYTQRDIIIRRVAGKGKK